MSEHFWLVASDRLLRLLVRFYPTDFREEVGPEVMEVYRHRCRAAISTGRRGALLLVWARAFWDSVSNGIAERLRPAASWRRQGNWGRDAELVVRRLVRAPVFAVAIVGTLTIGLGAFAVVYTVVYKVLLAPLPYEQPDDLYYVWRDWGGVLAVPRGALAGKDVVELQNAGGVIAGAAGVWQQPALFSTKRDANPFELEVINTSPNFFELLGVRPALGRAFVPHEVGPSRPAVIVLTHELWQGIGADPAIVGRTVWLTGQPFEVIGVLPKGFTFTRHTADSTPLHASAYIPFNVNLADVSNTNYSALIRVRPGTPAPTVAAAVEAVGRIIDARDIGGKGVRLYPVGLMPDLVKDVRPALVVLGAAGVFLVIALMANLATLLLARVAAREQEFAVSRALGANGSAVARATLLEGALLGFAGGVGGALVAVWAVRTIATLAPLDLPRRETLGMDSGIAAVVIAVGLVLGLLAATGPTLWATRASLSALMARVAVRGGGSGARMRQGMVVVQVALSLILLSAGGLVVRSFQALLRADPGFNPEGVLTLRVPMPPALFPRPDDVLAIQDRVHARLQSLPRVVRTSGATSLPMIPVVTGQNDIRIPNAPANTGDAVRDSQVVDVFAARAGYVEAMGMRMISGRSFGESRPQGVLEALVDRGVSDRFFPGGSAVGATVPIFGRTVTVVGVVEHVRVNDVHRDGRPQVYLRAEDFGARTLFWAVRTTRPPAAMMTEVEAAVRSLDPRLAVVQLRTMNEVVAESLSEQRIGAVLIGSFALGALLLAAMGLFGVVSGTVARRRHDLAMRLVLGADHRSVLQLVVTEGAALVALGILIGIPGVYAAGRVVQGVLVGISPFDAPTLLAVTIGLISVALAACYLPARAILRIEPWQTLRQE